MAFEKFRWQRYWCPSDCRFTLGDDGYLPDPLSAEGQQVNFDLVQYNEFFDDPCIVFLGEPGIGKSEALKDAHEWTQGTIVPSKLINLGKYGDEKVLVDEVFGDPVLIDRLARRELFTLFLDSLDECRLQIRTVARMLGRELEKRKQFLPNLRFRIACRDIDWPNSLEDSMKELWGSPPKILQLAPLRRIDIEIASRSLRTPETFMAEVHRLHAQPLAIKPVTLRFLLSTFNDIGRFPESRAELYELGCKILVTEDSKLRHEIGQIGKLRPPMRLEIASRLAAISMFSEVSGILVGNEWVSKKLNQNQRKVEELVGGNEQVDGLAQLVSEEAIEEVLNTSLFRFEAGNFAFSHQSYSEYLAARYLKHSNLRCIQKQNLLADSSFGRMTSFSQTREVAVWYATMDSEFFDLLMNEDPLTLLESDSISFSPIQAHKLFSRLVELFEAERINESDWDNWRTYRKLSHPGLADQLRSVLLTSKSESTRIFALHVINVLDESSLAEEVVKTALNENNSDQIRFVAVDAATSFAANEHLVGLKPLLEKRVSAEVEFAITERVLMALWPKALSARELFAALTATRVESHGHYRRFLIFEVVKHLHDADVPIALCWASQFDDETPRLDTFRTLIGQIARRAWASYSLPAIRESFLKFARNRIERHLPIFDSGRRENAPVELASDNPNRRDFIEGIVQQEHSTYPMLRSLNDPDCRFVYPRDLDWILENALMQSSDSVVKNWSVLAGAIFSTTIPGHVEAVIENYQKTPALLEEFKSRIEPVELGSSEAIKQKQNYELHNPPRRRRDKSPIEHVPPINEKIRILIEKCESGELEYWGQLVENLQLSESDQEYRFSFGADVESLFGWANADGSSKARITKIAKAYLEDDRFECGNDWLSENRFNSSIFYGYQALALLKTEAVGEFDSLSSEVWARWAPIVVWIQDFGSTHDDSTAKKILEQCHHVVPELCFECLRRILEGQNSRGGHVSCLRAIDRIWSDDVHRLLLGFISNGNTSEKFFEGLLEICLMKNSADAKQLAIELVTQHLPEASENRTRSIIAATQLMLHTDDSAWHVLWPKFLSDVAFGKEVVDKVAQTGLWNPTIVLKIESNQVAELYIWMVELYGFESTSVDFKDTGRAPDPSPEYRDSLLRALEHRGTEEAVDAVKSIATRFPEQVWLHRVLNSAIEKAVRNAWMPIEPRDFLSLIQRENFRLVQNAGQLQELILESLGRLQQKLQGEIPAVEDLWNADEPKDENYLSDYITRHLRDDLKGRGLKASREVEIRRGSGKGTGQRTDIYVTCAVIHPHEKDRIDTVRVIIEVKGMWHREWETAMKSQLVDRYHADNDCRHGIYLVGWYHGARWNKKSNSYKESGTIPYAKVDALLRKQAEDLTMTGSAILIRSFVLNCHLT